VFACISSLSTVSFWDDSKVSGTKSRNKTAGAYSGIPGDDMQARVPKGGLTLSARPGVAQTGGEPYRAEIAAPDGGRIAAASRDGYV
jgi:hypothetical protein